MLNHTKYAASPSLSGVWYVAVSGMRGRDRVWHTWRGHRARHPAPTDPGLARLTRSCPFVRLARVILLNSIWISGHNGIRMLPNKQPLCPGFLFLKVFKMIFPCLLQWKYIYGKINWMLSLGCLRMNKYEIQQYTYILNYWLNIDLKKRIRRMTSISPQLPAQISFPLLKIERHLHLGEKKITKKV